MKNQEKNNKFKKKNDLSNWLCPSKFDPYPFHRFPGQALFDAGSHRLNASFGQGDGILQQHRHGHGTHTCCRGVEEATKN
jgi:hypothetical protein